MADPVDLEYQATRRSLGVLTLFLIGLGLLGTFGSPWVPALSHSMVPFAVELACNLCGSACLVGAFYWANTAFSRQQETQQHV